MTEHNERQIAQEDTASEKREFPRGYLRETRIRVLKKNQETDQDYPLTCHVSTSFPSDAYKGSHYRPWWMEKGDDVSNYYLTIAGDTPITTEHWSYASDEAGALRNHANAVKDLMDKYNGEIIKEAGSGA